MYSSGRDGMVALGVLASLAVACSTDGGVELKPGTAVVYRRTLISNIGQIESMAPVDLAHSGDDVVVLIRYGWTIFTDHPPLPSEPDDTSTGSSATSVGFVLAVSRDGGATFASSEIYASESVSGEPLGVHLDGGRAWMILASDGPASSAPVLVHELDLDDFSLAPASPGQAFQFVNGGASSVAFAGGVMTMSVSDHHDSAIFGGSFGFQDLDLSTGTFTDRTTSLGATDDCTAKLYADAQGQTWEGYRDCLPGGQQLWCRFSQTASEAVPTAACVPRAEWPGPWADYTQAVTGAGLVQAYSRDGQAFAAQLRGSQPVEIALGAGTVRSDELRPGPLLRQAYGPLIPLNTPVDRLVALSSAGAALDVPMPTPCVEDDGCPAEVSRVLPLGGDDYLVLHTATLEGDHQQRTLLLRRDTVAPVPVGGGGGPAPVPGCPSAIPATAVVNDCAIQVATTPGLDIRNCISERTTRVDPACTPGEFSCEGDLACSGDVYGLDCAALGLPCSTEGSSGYPHCEDDTDPAQTCPTQSCAGPYMLVELGYERAYVDCPALGYATCVEEIAGYPRCVP